MEFVLSEENCESFERRGPMFKNLREFRWDELGLKQSNVHAMVFFLRECPMLEAVYIHVGLVACLRCSFGRSHIVMNLEILMWVCTGFPARFLCSIDQWGHETTSH